MQNFIPLLVFCLLVSACAEVENLHQMKDSTKNMEQTTGKMADVTAGMAKTTDGMAGTTTKMAATTDDMKSTTEAMHEKTKELLVETNSMKNTTNELYDALRQGNALQLRREAWESILKAATMYRKISEAGAYFMSFEVQLWNQYAQDLTIEKRDILAYQATKEFFTSIEELAPHDGSIDIMATPDPQFVNSESNQHSAFNALAMTMGQYNRKQLVALKDRHDLPLITMQSLMVESLLAKEQIEKGQIERLGTKYQYMREVLAHEEKAIQILRTQFNFAPLVFIEAATGLSDKWLPKQLWMLLVGWDLDLNKLSATQLEYFATEILEPALKSKEVLSKLGYETKLEYLPGNLIKHMKIKSTGGVNAHVAAQQTRVVALLKDLAK